MDIAVSAKKLNGSVTPPPFKSEVIRVMILSALCGRHPRFVLDPSAVRCDDVLSAERAVERAFFAHESSVAPIPVGASAALIRMLAPVLLFLRGNAEFSCEPQLIRRDMSELSRVLGCGVELDTAENTIRFIGGRLSEKRYSISAEKSSQFASGLLIAAAVKGFGVRVVSPVSFPYLELTLDCLHAFGVKASPDADGFFRFSGALSAPRSCAFAPDMSYAANFICADMLIGGSGDISIVGVELGDKQSDANAAKLFEEDELSVADSPDLFPLLCVYALKKEHDTVIRDTARLSDKESDRVRSVSAMISSLGGSMDIRENSVIVHGSGGRLRGGLVESFGDHRIVMAASIASLMCDGEVTILGAEAVSKSAPCFFDDFRRLGGSAHELIRH